ncbi:MAG: hypothetical protein JST39_02935, partial [Bacteroidetes bacterium]|nr:hypothetical protein [Bacteroidota bacterium]
MEERKFLNLSATECSNVYPAVLECAANHYRIAETLAESSFFGSAVAHLILGAEEQLKGMALFLDSKGFALRGKKGLNKLFHHHQSRHTIFKT